MQKFRRFAALFVAALLCAVASTPASAQDGWQQYPYIASPSDPADFTFPAAEGLHQSDAGDAWYITGYVNGQTTGHQYAYVVIFEKNHILQYATGGLVTVRTDFYTLALYDMTAGVYGQFSDFDLPPQSLLSQPKLAGATDHLELTYNSAAGPASWVTRTDSQGNLIPFAYHLDVVGTDSQGKAMHLVSDVDTTKAPVLEGANVFNGVITFFGQPSTFEYQLTRLQQTGTLTWGGVNEQVSGTLGHLDRQWSPQQFGVDSGLLGNLKKGIWSTLWLADGTDITLWNQVDMAQHDATLQYSGLTFSAPGTGVTPSSYAPDFAIQPLSYTRFPINQVQPQYPAPSNGIYYINQESLVSASQNLVLVGQWTINSPALALPVEYMEGPAHWTGTRNGQPVQADGIWELTLGYYRDWELVTVLENSLRGLPASAFTGTGTNANGSQMAAVVDGVSSYVNQGNILLADLYLQTQVAPALQTLAQPYQVNMQQIYSDLVAAVDNPLLH